MKKILIIGFVAAAMLLTACTKGKFHVDGTISEAKDSMLYFENLGLDGAVTLDSVKLDDKGAFAFCADAADAPEFYRLRIAGQIINVAADSTETITITAKYPTMSSDYTIAGSKDNETLRELAIKQQTLQQAINAVETNNALDAKVQQDSVANMIAAYKKEVRDNYIYKYPMKSFAYFALFQYIFTNGMPQYVFNPQTNPEDIKVYGAVATSWDTYFPGSSRGENLHNIAIHNMKDQRILQNQQKKIVVQADKVVDTGILEIALPDNKGVVRRLTELKGKVVMLDFHAFASNGSTERILSLRELYNKYHDRGLEIYQVSLDQQKHFWQTQTEALPWICVYDPNGGSAERYNVQSVPTFFLIDRNNTLQKRDVQISDIEKEIESML